MSEDLKISLLKAEVKSVLYTDKFIQKCFFTPKKKPTFPSPHGSVGPCPTAVQHDRSQPCILYCDYQDGDGDHYDNVHCDDQDESDHQDGGADQSDNLSFL